MMHHIYIKIHNSLFVGFWVGLSGLLLGNGNLHGAQTWWVGGAWSNLDFLRIFLASCYDIGLPCTSFFVFLKSRSSHEAQTQWVGGA